MNHITTLHDAVYAELPRMGAIELASELYDTDEAAGCNGIHAVADTSASYGEALARVESLMHGMCPPGIRPHNEYAAAQLSSRWSDYCDMIRAESGEGGWADWDELAAQDQTSKATPKPTKYRPPGAPAPFNCS
jgi:hypothetical protein